MVNRLDPRPSAGSSRAPPSRYSSAGPRTRSAKSFLEIVHPDDHPRGKEQIKTALEKGRPTADRPDQDRARRTRAIEMNIGVRYGPDRALAHLRCHMTDVTDKIRAERELGCGPAS